MTRDPWLRSKLFNDLYRVAWTSFQLLLKTNVRKRKLNEVTAVTVHNRLVKKGFIKQIRDKNGLATVGQKKNEWSYKLPPMNLAEEGDDVSPIVDEDDVSSA